MKMKTLKTSCVVLLLIANNCRTFFKRVEPHLEKRTSTFFFNYFFFQHSQPKQSTMFATLLLLLAVCAAPVVAAPRRIDSLPGFGTLPSTWHAGFADTGAAPNGSPVRVFLKILAGADGRAPIDAHVLRRDRGGGRRGERADAALVAGRTWRVESLRLADRVWPVACQRRRWRRRLAVAREFAAPAK